METDVQKSEYSTGELLGRRFEILELLGRGGFGETYAAVDNDQGGEVAVKVLQLQRLKDWKALERFEREARVLESLDHPRIPDYVDFIQDENSGRAYLAQELAPGRSIGNLLADGRRFSQDEAIEIAEQILDVLTYLESLRPRVVHRDIKPDNLLIAEDNLFVVDFGSVREVARQSGEGSTVAGTFGYMAPEQLMGRATPASDIFGLGMTLIHMLTGMPPNELEQRRGRPDFRPRAKVSDWFAELIAEMTVLIVDDRIATASRCLALLKARGTPLDEELTAIQAERLADLAEHQTKAEARRQTEQEKAQLTLAAVGEALQLETEGNSLRVHYRPPLKRAGLNGAGPFVFWTLNLTGFSCLPFIAFAFGFFTAGAIISISMLLSALTLIAVISPRPFPLPITLEVEGNHFRLKKWLHPARRGRVPRLCVKLDEPEEELPLGRIRFEVFEEYILEGLHITADEIDELEKFLKQNRITVHRLSPPYFR